MLYPLSRAALFKLDPETAHAVSLAVIAKAGAVPPVRAALAACFCVPDAEPVVASVAGQAAPVRRRAAEEPAVPREALPGHEPKAGLDH